jgi:Outer membrane cobalamin receptor protein
MTKTIHNWEDIGTLSVKGEVRNMFDEDYETIYAYPMPGRSFYVGLQYEY